MNKLALLQTMALMAAAEGAIHRPNLYSGLPDHDALDWSDFPVGREVAVGGRHNPYPLVVKGVTQGMLKLEGKVLGRFHPGEQVLVNSKPFYIHRVASKTLLLRPA